MSIPNLEIRLLKARTKAAEDCLRFVLLRPSAPIQSQFDFASWWMPLHIALPHQAALSMANRQPLSGLLRVARLRKADKQLHRLDAKLALLDAIAPVEVAAAHQIKDYYKDLGRLVPKPPLLPATPLEPDLGRDESNQEADRMFGYNFCPVKYVRAAGSKLQALKYKFGH